MQSQLGLHEALVPQHLMTGATCTAEAGVSQLMAGEEEEVCERVLCNQSMHIFCYVEGI